MLSLPLFLRLASCVFQSCVFSGSFQRSIDLYHADRGGELKLPGPDGSSLAVFYFEWDTFARWVDRSQALRTSLQAPFSSIT